MTTSLPALRNSVILVVGAVAIVIAVGAPAAYALSRVRFPGRDLFLYLLLLLSSVITGAAAILPLYLLMFGLDMIDTYWGVWLALAGGLLPARDLHPQGLHRLDPAQLRGIGARLRGVARSRPCATSCSR